METIDTIDEKKKGGGRKRKDGFGESREYVGYLREEHCEKKIKKKIVSPSLVTFVCVVHDKRKRLLIWLVVGG